MLQRTLRIALVCLVGLLSACTTTEVDESWALPGYSLPQEKNMLVIVLSGQPKIRELVELEFVSQFKALGIAASPSVLFLTDEEVSDRKQVAAVVEEQGFTLVLVSSLRSIEKNTVYQPAQEDVLKDGLYRTSETYYAFSSSGQHQTGQYVESLEYIVESNIYDVELQEMAWSIYTRTLEAVDIEKGAKSMVRTVVNQAQDSLAF